MHIMSAGSYSDCPFCNRRQRTRTSFSLHLCSRSSADACTPTPDGKLIHSEVDLGGVTLMIVDRLDGWAARPGLLQVWVDDVQTTLQAASTQGASVVTPATPFYEDPLPAWEGGSDLMFPTIDEAMTGFALGLVAGVRVKQVSACQTGAITRTPAAAAARPSSVS